MKRGFVQIKVNNYILKVIRNKFDGNKKYIYKIYNLEIYTAIYKIDDSIK